MYDKPLPVIDDDSRPYWDGARAHRLMLQRCATCARAIFYPRSVCPHCGSTDLDWFEASGTGTVHSFTVARRPAGPAFADAVPLVIALVDLDEGVRMLSNVRADPADMTIDARVTVWFDDVTPEVTLPKFDLA
jgi:uncharacterized OB-fold protein